VAPTARQSSAIPGMSVGEAGMDNHDSRLPWFTRRAVLGTAAGAALGAYGLSRGLAAEVPDVFDGTQFKMRAPEPNAKRGGILRYGVLSAPAHVDVHQSGTVSNIGTQGCMYDNLIRRDPRDSGQSIIPDLAHSWGIAKDGKTYTFFLRKGVKFHDGGDFTAEDVKATYTRLITPPTGFSSPRTPLFSAVREISVRDPHIIEFKLSEARPKNFMLGAFASGWNIIVRKKTLEDNNYNLRQVMDYPGTGPFRHKKRVDKEVWAMERNPDYWNEGLPYLDGLEFYHLTPWAPEVGASLLAGKVDYARAVDPVSLRKIQSTPGMSGTDFYQSVIIAHWINNEKKPFGDPRVRRAMHLVLDRHALTELVKDVSPSLLGGFLYPFSEYATPTAKLVERLGYQRDTTASVQEARKLMAAAGYPNGLKLDFLVRDSPNLKLWAVASQAMLKETLNIEANIRMVQISVWFDEALAGTFDLTISAIVSTLLDPSDYFNAWYAKGAPQNYSRWSNTEFQDLLPQIDRELDETRRKTLIRQAENILEQDPPLLPVSWEKVNDAWHNYVKGHNPYNYFGLYDVVRFDTFWLDK
jgi:peptide/nickel transport system substrate-binding protein